MPAKKQTPTELKYEKVELDLFEVLNALDKKDYFYYDSLTEEQKKKVVPFMLIHWMSAIKGAENVSKYYVLSANEYGNKYLFNEFVSKHPKLQWLMLCGISPDKGKQYHQWIPHIKDKVAKYKENANLKDIKDYFTKIYPKADANNVSEISKAYVTEQKRKTYLAELFPNMKITDIDTLNELITDEDIQQYERDRGNL